MKYPNRTRGLIVFCGLGLLLLPLRVFTAGGSDQSVEVGYISLTTAQEADRDGEPASFAPDVLIRFARAGGSTVSIYAMTDQTGTALVPLEPGTYCATAYGLDGKPVSMSKRSMEPTYRCFSIKSGTMIEFSVTLARGVKYAKSIPR